MNLQATYQKLSESYRGLIPEDRLVVKLIAISFLVHLGFLVMDRHYWLEKSPLFQEWEIEADLLVGNEGAIPDKSTLPKADEADEASVPDNLLPQLSKKFSINETDKNKEVDAEEGLPEKEKEKVEKPVDEKSENQVVKKNLDESNKIEEEDALRRIAIEKLKREQKFSKTWKAEQADAIARLKQEEASANNHRVGQSGLGLEAAKQYQSRVRSQVRKCYMLPSAYNYQDAELNTIVEVIVSETGGLLSLKVSSPSGDKVFDDLAYKTIQDCAPLPIPPKELVGAPLLLKFSPKSF